MTKRTNEEVDAAVARVTKATDELASAVLHAQSVGLRVDVTTRRVQALGSPTVDLPHVMREALMFHPRRPGFTPERCLYEALVWEEYERTSNRTTTKEWCAREKEAWLSHACALEKGGET